MTMEMGERAILRDCLDTLKHASMCYLRASLEADSDPLRQTFDGIAIDKSEAKNAVFNLMHQAGIYETRPANPAEVEKLREACRQFLAQLDTGHGPPVARELGASAAQELGVGADHRPSP